MRTFVLIFLVGLCFPAQAVELLRLEARWEKIDGWANCGEPVIGSLKVQGPAYVKMVVYENPYTPLNFAVWDPVGFARFTREGDPVRDNPGVTTVYSKLFQGGQEARDLKSMPLRREHKWHFTENEAYYYDVGIASPCVRQAGGGQQAQSVFLIITTEDGPDYVAAPETPPFETTSLQPTARTEYWQVQLDPGGYLSTFELQIDANGKVDGISRWTCCSGPVNRITGVITPSGDIELTRHLEGDHTGMSHTWTGHYTANGKSVEGAWSSGSYGHGNGYWRAQVESSGPVPTAQPDKETTTVAMGSLAGQWRITANGYPGTIEFTASGGNWTGRENIDGAWSPIQDIVSDPGSGRIEFTRPLAAQRYKGTLSAEGMSGTFDQGGVGQYAWSATR